MLSLHQQMNEVFFISRISLTLYPSSLKVEAYAFWAVHTPKQGYDDICYLRWGYNIASTYQIQPNHLQACYLFFVVAQSLWQKTVFMVF